jgi:hypothetical protein
MSSSTLNQLVSGTQSPHETPALPMERCLTRFYYLQSDLDVADGVAQGVLQSGFEHRMTHGRSEGRLPRPLYDEGDYVNTSWYLPAYRAAEMDIESGRTREGEHQTLGRFGVTCPTPMRIALFIPRQRHPDLVGCG